MGILLRSGRAFTEQDDTDTPPVIVINRSMAEQFWPNRDPLGERLTIRNIEVSIVGVVADVVGNDVIATPGPAFYLPLAQEVDRVWQLDHMSYVVRTAASPRGLAPAMRAVLREAGPSLPPGPILSMDDVILSSMGERVFQTRILVVFAVLALLLAGVGIYGVTAYSVSERTYEIGIRMALGARGGQVASMTLGRVLMLVIPGLVLGSAGGLAASRLIAASLYEIEPSDPVTFVGVALLLGGVAITAALVPARRATRVNPVEVLSR
jgi:putative ABC transport system permease protein